MLSDFMWRLFSLVLRFFRIFDKMITADSLWKVKVHKLTNCWALPPTDFKFQVEGTCIYGTKRYGEESYGVVSIESPCDYSAKINEEKLTPRCTVKYYVPFKAKQVKLSLHVYHWACGACPIVKEAVIEDVKPGIHFHEFFVKDIGEYFKKG